MNELLKLSDIINQLTILYSSHFNGMARRINGTSMDIINAMLTNFDLPNNL
jgi:hypothetical protein